jgi:3-methyladenine DNA glycosylase/8-oxoguanine DNA glycosylase
VQLRGEAWRPYRTFATWYFWEISSTPTTERILW